MTAPDLAAIREKALAAAEADPVGRDAPPAVANGYCDEDCPGYHSDPYPPHLWPDEEIPNG